jgi:hypothetical protein
MTQVWKDLLQAPDETIVLPWVGGRVLQTFDRTWRLKGRQPAEHGWHTFRLDGRNARWVGPADPPLDALDCKVRGYLVGDRLVPDGLFVPLDPAKLIELAEQVFLIEPGIDRFVRVVAGRMSQEGPLVYEGLEFPLGPEDEVQNAFLDGAQNVDAIVGVVPALDGAFRFEKWQRDEADKRRREEERRRREEEERLAQEERRRQIREQLGDAQGRRAMAQLDFREAARAALEVGGAEYLDHRAAPRRNEMIVKYRWNRRRFECVCDARTLRIIDAGVCLTDHGTGQRGDTWLTLESLPGVIRQADREHKLVVFRHV